MDNIKIDDIRINDTSTSIIKIKSKIKYLQPARDDMQAVSIIDAKIFKDAWSYESFCDSFDSINCNFLVAKLDKDVIGYIIAYMALDEADIVRVAVVDEYRSRGVGDALIKNMEILLLKKGIKFLALEVRCSNSKAIALYEKNNFKQVGIRKKFYTSPTEDAIIMTKEIIDA